MGVFEFVIVLVVVTTIGKVVTELHESRTLGRQPSIAPPAEIEHLREAMDEMSTRLQVLEEERDFYRKLLEAPDRDRASSATREPSPTRAPRVTASHQEGP